YLHFVNYHHIYTSNTSLSILFLFISRPPIYTLFPYTTLFRSHTAKTGSNCYVTNIYRGTRFPYQLGAKKGNISSKNTTGFASLRSEEHTSELQSRFDLVCRLLLEKKNSLYSIVLAFIDLVMIT